MAASKTWTENPDNIQMVLAASRASPTLTLRALAEALETSESNVRRVLQNHMPPAEFSAQKALRYSISKEGEKNPMKGKSGAQHHNWIEQVSDGKGYLTTIHNNERQFVHRVVMAVALGIPKLPENLDVHHIDSNPLNNSLDNLALVTRAGHKTIHSLQMINATEKLRRSTIADLYRSGISQ